MRAEELQGQVGIEQVGDEMRVPGEPAYTGGLSPRPAKLSTTNAAMPHDVKRLAQASSRSSEMPPMPCARTTAGTLPARSSAPPGCGSESVPLTTVGGPLRYARVRSGPCEAGV